jgi:hypothetical protein
MSKWQDVLNQGMPFPFLVSFVGIYGGQILETPGGVTNDSVDEKFLFLAHRRCGGYC